MSLKKILVIFSTLTCLSCQNSLEDYNHLGLDISHHQKNIDWKKISKNNLKFIFLKATEGGDFKDTKFDEYWSEVKNINVPVGAYHFFTFCRDVDDQIKNFLENPKVLNSDLLPVIDVEFAGNCKKRPEKDSLRLDLIKFKKAIKEKIGKNPIIYTTKWFHFKYLRNWEEKNKYWIRSVYFDPNWFFYEDWVIWQFEEGFVTGYPEIIDKNVLNTKNYSIKDIKI